MKTLLSAILLTLAAAWAAPPLSADVSVEIDFHYFHERLAPHGHWIEVDGHGWCWYPADIDDGWRPYTHGHWVWVEPDGWCWVSDYDWGWACEHYGRWYHTGHRWVWVPGYEWCGAWVVWRHGDGFVGWAPLPPAVTWDVGIGLHLDGFRYDMHIYEPSWVFCHETWITHTHIHTVVIHDPRIVIHRTRVIGSVTLHNRTVVTNRAFRVERAEAVGSRPVKRVRIEATATLGATRVDRERDDRIRVFRPRVKAGSAGDPREVNAVEAERKTLREKHDTERREGRGGRDVETRQQREVQEADRNVRNRLEKRRPPEGRRETPTRRDTRDARPGRETPQGREQDRPRRETPQGREQDRPRRETPQGREQDRPRRETPQGREQPRPRRETPQGREQPRPRRETPQGREQPKPRREAPKGREQPAPRRDTPQGRPQQKPREEPKAREGSRTPKQSGRVPNGKRRRETK